MCNKNTNENDSTENILQLDFKKEVTIQLDEDDKPHKSNQCSSAFKSINHVRNHESQVRGNRDTFALKVSDFTTALNLKLHSTKHSDERSFKCNQCGKGFKGRVSLANHKKLLHATERSFRCEVCPKTFVSATYLKLHTKMVHCEEKSHECDQCSKSFKSSYSLYNHLRQTHSNDAKFFCDVCGKIFVWKWEFKQHVVSHSDKREFKCHDCDKEYKSKKDLVHHIMFTHATEKPFRCEECPKSFATVVFLKRHAIMHSENRPFRCDKCRSAFKTQSSLTRHKIRIHGSGCKFSCEMCGRGFQRLDKLKQHMAMHSNRNNFQFDQCDKAFVSKRCLNSHKTCMHYKEKPFKCALCPKMFKHRTKCAKHFNSVHKRNEGTDMEGTKTIHDATVKREMFGDVKVEPVIIYDQEEKRIVTDIKDEIKEEIDLNVKQEPEEIH